MESRETKCKKICTLHLLFTESYCLLQENKEYSNKERPLAFAGKL